LHLYNESPLRENMKGQGATIVEYGRLRASTVCERPEPGHRITYGNILGLLTAILFLMVPAGSANDVTDPWVYYHAGQEHFFNLEYEQALEDYQAGLELDPNNAFFYNAIANVYLFQELYRLGQLEGNLYDASNSFLKEKKRKPSAEQISKMKAALIKTRGICEARLRKNPQDTDALYNLGISYSTEGNYKFTIEKSWFDALRAGGKANELHEKLLKIDPDYHDAKLVPGVYQYVVGSIPGSVKWFAFLIGYRGSKVKGIRLIQDAMTKGERVGSGATFLLMVIYSREKEHDYARQLLRSLEEFYPRNPLIPLEIARSYAREQKRKEALEQYVRVANDMEAGRAGYEKLPRERIWYQVGVLHQRQGELEPALQAFARITNHSDGDGLLKAHSGLRRGEIFLAQNRPDQARMEFERVAGLPYEEPRRVARERLSGLDP
jgi:tetratricopeptide (TPR) repeat protein